MADDSYLLSYDLLERCQGFVDARQIVGAQGAEAFVNEDGIRAEVTAVEAAQAEGQGERCHEAFSSAQRVHRPRCLVLLLVLHQDNQGAFLAHELVTVGELAEVEVCVFQQNTEKVALGNLLEELALSCSEQAVQRLIAGEVREQIIIALAGLLHVLLLAFVLLEDCIDRAVALVKLADDIVEMPDIFGESVDGVALPEAVSLLGNDLGDRLCLFHACFLQGIGFCLQVVHSFDLEVQLLDVLHAEPREFGEGLLAVLWLVRKEGRQTFRGGVSLTFSILYRGGVDFHLVAQIVYLLLQLLVLAGRFAPVD